MSKSIIPNLSKIKSVVSHTNIDPEIKTLFDSANLEQIEDIMMSRIEEKPDDLAFTLPILRAFVRRKDTDRAETLLQLLIDTLREKGKTDGEYEVFSSVLTFWPESKIARTGLLEHIHKAYGDSTNYDLLVKHCNIEGSPDPFKALHLLETWLRFDIGRGVFLPKMGIGRIREINPKLNIVRVKFQKGDDLMSLRITEAERMLEFLPKGHILLEKLENIESLKAIAKENPGELLQKLFTSFERSMPVTEIKEHLLGIIEPKAWSTWWGKARKNPCLTIGSGTKPMASWNESAEDADQQISKQFLKTKPRDKLELLQKHSGRSKELLSTMIEDLHKTVAQIKDSDRVLALEIALAMERVSKQYSESDIIKSILSRNDAAHIIIDIKDRTLRKNAVALIKESREEWETLFISLLRSENDNQIITLIYEELFRANASDMILAGTLGSPDSAQGFYLWICRNILNRPELEEKLDATFVQKLTGTLNNPSFKNHFAFLRKMFDPGGPVDKAIRKFDTAQAKSFLSHMDRAGSLEEYRRDDLRNEINRLFPSLEEKKEDYFFTTAEALEQKRKEFAHLTKVEIPENTEQLRIAKEQGDLRENFEYKAARMRQELLSSRAKTLHDQISLSKLIEPGTVDTSQISIGTKITLRPIGNGDENLTITILGTWESDPTQHIYSHLAPAASAIMGKKAGDDLEFNNSKFVVEDIRVWNEN